MQTSKYIDLRGLLSYQILHEIGRKPRFGDELANIIGNRKGSKLTPGTIYPALKRLRENKLIIATKIGRRVVYKLTAKGKKEYKTARKYVRILLKSF
jgi:DNA-binding PadR family transcriptional regulator